MANKKQYSSTGWLARETIKGLPKAGEKVGKTIGRAVGKAMKFPFSSLRRLKRKTNITQTSPSLEDRSKRKGNLMRMRTILNKYRKTHPKFKLPREFRDLK